MVYIKLIKPKQLYAGLPQGWWLKTYWEHVYPLVLRAYKEKDLPAPDESQAGPIMYAVGRYARAFAEPQRVVKLDENTKTERYYMTNTIHRGFVLPFVKFIALESDGDGSSFSELRNVAQSLSLDSDVVITFEVSGGMLIEEGKEIGDKIHIETKDAMDYYCESFPIELPTPLYEQVGSMGSQTNKAISSAFMAVFEPQGEGTYTIDVTSRYLFRFRGKSKDYGPLNDRYEVVVAPPIEKTPEYRKGII